VSLATFSLLPLVNNIRIQRSHTHLLFTSLTHAHVSNTHTTVLFPFISSLSAASRELVRLFASAAEKDPDLPPARVPLEDIPLLLLANKQDMPGALSARDVSEALDIDDLPCRQRTVIGCSATDLKSLQTAMRWMTGIWANADGAHGRRHKAASSKITLPDANGASTPTSIMSAAGTGL
jgi:hypothetical protein